MYTGICDEFCTQETPEKNVNSLSARVEVVFNKVILPLHMVGPLQRSLFVWLLQDFVKLALSQWCKIGANAQIWQITMKYC